MERYRFIRVQLQVVQGRQGPHVCHAASRHNSLFKGGSGGCKSVLCPLLSFLKLRFGWGAHLDYGYTAGELCNPLVELFLVILRGGLFELDLNLVHPGLDHVCVAAAVDNSGLVLGGLHAAGPAQVGDCGQVQLAALLLGDDLAAGQDGKVFQHRLAAVAESGSLYGQTVDDAAHFVHHQHGQCLAFDVLTDDHQVFGNLEHLFQQRHQFGGGGNLLVGNQNVGVFDGGVHALRVGDKVRADVAPVESHAVDELGLGLGPLAFFDGYYAVPAHLFHHFRQSFTNLRIVGGDSGYLGDVVPALHGDGQFFQLGHDGGNAPVQAGLNGHGVGAGGYVLHAFFDDDLSQHGGGCRAVAGNVVGLGGRPFNQLGAHVLEGLGKFNLFGDGNPVIGDHRRSPFALQNHVAPIGAQGHFDGFGQLVNASQQGLLRILVMDNLLGWHSLSPSWGS